MGHSFEYMSDRDMKRLDPVTDQFLQASPVAGGIVQLDHGDELVLPGVGNECVEGVQVGLGAAWLQVFGDRPDDPDGVGSCSTYFGEVCVSLRIPSSCTDLLLMPLRITFLPVGSKRCLPSL